MTNSDKDKWRKKWLGCINELTSLGLQEKSWLDRTNTNPHWSFVEFMCSYFDDLAIDDNYKDSLKNGWVTEQEFEIIRDWHEALDKYETPKNDDYDNDAVLNDLKWLGILQTGVQVKFKLTETLSEREKQILNEEINYLNYV